MQKLGGRIAGRSQSATGGSGNSPPVRSAITSYRGPPGRRRRHTTPTASPARSPEKTREEGHFPDFLHFRPGAG